jgi:polo-like kinase 1
MSPEDKNQTDIVEIIEEKITKVNGDIAIKRYEKGKLLGKGGFAKCFEFKDLETSKIYAAKII